MKRLFLALLFTRSALANADIDPNGIPAMELQPDPMNAPALEPGSANLPQAETNPQLAQDENPPLSNQEKLQELETNSNEISPQIAEENQQLEALPK